MSYNREWIENRLIRKSAEKLHANKLISEEQKINVFDRFKDEFYSPNLFIRIGLFIFTLVLANAALGIFGSLLVAMFSDDLFFGLIMIAGGGIYIFALEHFIKYKFHYKSGMDDCLLYMAVVFVIVGIAVIFEFTSALGISMLCLPFLMYGAYRYADAFLSFLSFACLFIVVFLITVKSVYGKLFLPFIFMFISGLILTMVNVKRSNEKLFYWKNCFNTLKVTSLLCLYLSVNYFIVKEANAAINDGYSYSSLSAEAVGIQNKIDENNLLIDELSTNELNEASQQELNALLAENNGLYKQFDIVVAADNSNLATGKLPFHFLFLAFTFLIPLFYLLIGIRKRERLLLWNGMITVVFASSTLLYIFKNIPEENLMVISGIIILLVSYFSIRYLKNHRGRYTYESEMSQDFSGVLNAEGLLIGSTLGNTANSNNNDLKFGGGSYGGGGAGGSF